MSDAREIPALLEAAERAASSGDLTAAEALLHEVVRLQEAAVGPGHVDLASTYNNLAVVCEMAGRPTDAEQFYRRAYGIASTALDPKDPLVTTSFHNLKEFCQARGVPLEVAAKMPAEPLEAAVVPVAKPASGSTPAAPRTPVGPPSQREAVPATADSPGAVGAAESTAPLRRTAASGTVIFGVIAAAAVVAVLAVAWPSRETRAPEADVPPPASSVAASPTPAAPPDEAPAAPAAAAAMPEPRAAGGAAPAGPASQGPGSRPTGTRVLDARLCQNLSTQGGEWRCEAPSNPAAPGRLSFYTRIAASADVRVRHRWYHGDSLVRDVGLLVRANTGAGYRTYSRQTVNASGGADWRVEVTTPDGALLREERFVVR